MIDRMLMRRRLPRSATWFAVPLALWAALPSVQWCPVGWDQICVQNLVRCAAIAQIAIDCAVGGDVCPLGLEAEPSCRAIADDEETTESCPLESETQSGCGSDEVDGLAADSDGCGSQACPLAAARARGTEHARSFPHGRTYCLAGPNGGAALRASAPLLPSISSFIAILAVVDALESNSLATLHHSPEPDARPPTRAWALLPPGRAPPSLPLT